jgi:S1-C subfamily serine protease
VPFNRLWDKMDQSFSGVSMRLPFILSLFLLSLLQATTPEEERLRSAIVKVYTVVKTPNYSVPWSSSIQQVSGSGAVIEGRRILTNAHVVANRTFIEVQRYGERRRYIARVEAVSHQLDLALLRVEDPKFFEGIPPLKLGTLPQIEQKVSVYGFPMGGDTLSVTAGVVSRIEHQRYVHSGESFLAIQIDAAVNPGNSGGPAISGGKIVGVVMEGIQKAQNISYLVPTVMIRHFLKDLEDGKLDGVPAFAVLTQPMENPSLKSYYGLGPHQGGVLVDMVVPTGGLEGILKKGDVITSIDGHPIQEDATASFRRHEYTNYEYYVQLHQIGEKVTLELIRDGKKFRLEAPLLKKAAQMLLIGTYRYDRMPRYVILGGYVFSPLTRNLAVQVARSRIDLIPYMDDFVSKKRREVVLLLRVLPSALSRGDYGYVYWPVRRIDGKRYLDFNDFYRRLIEGSSPTVVLENKLGQRVIIDRKRALKMQKEILRKYNIEYDRSEEFRKDTPNT